MSAEMPALIPDTAGATPEQMRGRILAFEAMLLAKPEAHVTLETVHHFAPGVYMRELRIPAGVALTGKIHKTEHLNILAQGELEVATEDGSKLLTACTVIKSNPGIKRAGFAHKDSVWITVHPNVDNEQDVNALESRLVTETYEQFLEFKKQIGLITEGGQ